MSFKQSLMASAPPVPGWFEPELPPKPQEPKEFVGKGDHADPDRYKAYLESVHKWMRDVKAWELEREQERVFQWPEYYALSVINRTRS